MLSLPYGLNLISVHDYRKSLSFDYMELFQQSDVSDFLSLIFNMLLRFRRKGKLYPFEFRVPKKSKER